MNTAWFRDSSTRLRIFLLLTLLLLSTSTLHSQAQVYTTDQLIQIGRDVYKQGDYVGASMFLFAYIQKQPALMSNNPQFGAQVQKAYQFSLDAARKAWNASPKQSAGSTNIPNLGSSTQGLSVPPPLDIPGINPKTQVPPK